MARMLLVVGFLLTAFSAVHAQETRQLAGSIEATKLFQDARQLQQERRFAAALQQWQAFVRQFPTDPAMGQALLGLGTCLIEAGQHEQAVEALDQALRKLPPNHDETARWNLAIALGKRGEATDSDADFARAASLFQKFALSPTLAQNKRALAYRSWGDMEFAQIEVAEKKKRWQEAGQGYRSFVQNFPEHPRIDQARLGLVEVYMAQNKNAEAEKILASLDVKSANAHADYLLLRWGEMLAGKGSQLEAAQKWGQLIERYPQSQYRNRALRLRGEALTQVPGQQAEALKLLATWIEHNPNDPTAISTLYRTATLAALLGDAKHAQFYANQVKQRTNDRVMRAQASHLLAQCAFAGNDAVEAMRNMQEFVQLEPQMAGKPDVMLLMARCQAALHRHEDALANFTSLLTTPHLNLTEPDRVRAEAIGSALALRKDLLVNEARWLRELFQEHPRSPWTADAHLKAAQHAARMKAYSDTHALAKIALDTGSQAHRPHALYLIGFASLNLRKSDEAIAAYRALLEQFPTYDKTAEARFAMAQSLESGNRKTEAAQAFELFSRLHANHPLVGQARQHLAQIQRDTPFGNRVQ